MEYVGLSAIVHFTVRKSNNAEIFVVNCRGKGIHTLGRRVKWRPFSKDSFQSS